MVKEKGKKKIKALASYGQHRREKKEHLQVSFQGRRTEPLVGNTDLGENTISTRVETFSECLIRHGLTAASVRPRKKRKHRRGKDTELLFGVEGDAINSDDPGEDLDARIARLEAELQEESESFTPGGDNECQTLEKLTSPILVNPSNRIVPLPTSLLPEASCGLSSSSVKQRKRNTGGDNEGRNKLKGLEVSVQELLSSYKPRSGERVPFWCRCCQFQGSKVEDLQKHRETEFHKEAERLERKVSYCRMCRKQFTSPPQLREHLQGKAHKLRLETLLAKQEKKRPAMT